MKVLTFTLENNFKEARLGAEILDPDISMHKVYQSLTNACCHVTGVWASLEERGA